MVMISFRTKKDKERLLEKAKKMEDYASMIVECLEDSEYEERAYRHYEDEDDEMMDMNDRMIGSRYGYRKMNKRMN